jgi:hypothetical protein
VELDLAQERERERMCRAERCSICASRRRRGLEWVAAMRLSLEVILFSYSDVLGPILRFGSSIEDSLTNSMSKPCLGRRLEAVHVVTFLCFKDASF